MTTESTFIELMRAIATDPSARGLNDDAAVIEFGNESLILTHDMMVEGVHWLPNADPADVAWKLVAVNLSDLAAKGAEPVGVLLGFTLGDNAWDSRFAEGLKSVLSEYGVPLLGGDTVGAGDSNRAMGMTALGRATHRPVPARNGANPGDALFVTGTLGDAAAGFAQLQEAGEADTNLAIAFRRPRALLSQGQRLVPLVKAMMDVSDGLLLDASRMAVASDCGIAIDLAVLPLSAEYRAVAGDDLDSRLHAASWGDDYQLLFATSADADLPVAATKVGQFFEGEGLRLTNGDAPVPLPPSLGYQHC